MKKVLEGWELMKMIAEEKIKEDTEFECNLGVHIIYSLEEIRIGNKNDIGNELHRYYTFKDIANADFEIIQDDIDIDSIEEISFELDNNGIATKTINELIKAVKQLNKKIGE